MENYTAKDFPYRSSPMLLRHNTLQHFRSPSAEHGNEYSNSGIHRSTPPGNRRRIRSDPGSSLRGGSISTRPKRASSFTEYRERHLDRNRACQRSKSVSTSSALSEARNQTETIRTVSRSVDYYHHLSYQDSDSSKGVVDKWKRILFKQISDSAILSRRRPRMTQEIQQMERISPSEPRQAGERRPGEDAENSPSKSTTKSKALKHLQHPRKKFIRTQSESAIDVNNIRNRRTNQLCGPSDLKGIVCTNDDLKKILMDAKRIGFGRQRTSTLASPSKFEALPEVTEKSFETRINGRRRSPPPDLNVVWSKGPRRQHSIDLSGSPSGYSPKSERPRARKVSPKASPISKRNGIEASCPHGAVAAAKLSPVGTCERCREERTMMLHGEDQCHLSLEVSKSPPVELEETPENVDPLAGLAESFGGLDPQILGEAIERRLALAERTPPQKKSPTKIPEGKNSPQSFRALWGQNNAQLSNRLGNLVSKFPFKKDVGQPGTSGISV